MTKEALAVQYAGVHFDFEIYGDYNRVKTIYLAGYEECESGSIQYDDLQEYFGKETARQFMDWRANKNGT